MKKIVLLSGSLRKDSVNTKVLKAFEKMLEGVADVSWADINLPLFSEDLESDFPASAQKLGQQIAEADAVIISTPEYNRGMSGALKNAIDWASRPYGENSFKGKKVLVASASPGSIGGALALYQVKQSLLHLGAEVIAHPESIFTHAFDKFDKDGVLIDERSQGVIADAIAKL